MAEKKITNRLILSMANLSFLRFQLSKDITRPRYAFIAHADLLVLDCEMLSRTP